MSVTENKLLQQGLQIHQLQQYKSSTDKPIDQQQPIHVSSFIFRKGIFKLFYTFLQVLPGLLSQQSELPDYMD